MRNCFTNGARLSLGFQCWGSDLLAIVTMGAALALGVPLMGGEAGVAAHRRCGNCRSRGRRQSWHWRGSDGGWCRRHLRHRLCCSRQQIAYRLSEWSVGQIGDGQLAPNLGALGEQAQGLAAAVAPKMDAGIIGDTLDGAKRMAYGDCEGNAGAQCNEADPGIAPRTNSYRQQNIPLQLWDARKQCEMAGNMGAALDRCTARMENLRAEQEQQQQ